MRAMDHHLCDLLYEHDCVIVPGLGGFLASYQGASVHPVSHIITPPSRRIAFNVFLKQNDGLLANHVASDDGISYSEAVQKIERYAEACRGDLDKGRRVVISGLGALFNDSEGNLQFEPLPGANFLPESFGLGLLRHLPIDRDGRPRAEVRPLSARPLRPSAPAPRSVQPHRARTLSRILVAGVAIWLGVNAFFFIQHRNDSGPQTTLHQEATRKPSPAQASVQPPVSIESTAAMIMLEESSYTAPVEIPASAPSTEKTAGPVDTPEEQPQHSVYHGVTGPFGVVSAQHSEEKDASPQRNFTFEEIKTGTAPPSSTEVKEEKPADVTATRPAAAAPAASSSSSDHSGDRYFVIAGAFGVESNAEAMVEKLRRQGFAGARIVPSASHKLTLVCYGGAATRAGANGLLDSLRTTGRDGWLLAQ